MGFIFTDLVIESIIRDGLVDMKNKLATSDDQVPDVFSELLASHLSVKYGQGEIDSISTMVGVQDTIHVVHSFAQVDTKTPCISIHLMDASEDEQHAVLGDFGENHDYAAAPTEFVSSFDCDSYNSVTGIIDVSTADPNLAPIRRGHIFKDGSGNQYEIKGAITNESGNKKFGVEKDLTLNLVGCTIISQTNFQRREEQTIPDRENVMVGIHTENALQTKWLYNIVKYILLSRKDDLFTRGLRITALDASDFGFDVSKIPSNIYTRFITLKALVYHKYETGLVTLVDTVESVVRTQRRPDKIPRENEDEMTVRTLEDPDLEN